VERLAIIGALFVLAGLCEIGGGYLVWGWVREGRPVAWALIGAGILAAYGVVAALQPTSEFGRVYAAYGGVFIALALAWRAGGRVQAGPVGPARRGHLRGGRAGDGRPSPGMRLRHSPECVEGTFSECRMRHLERREGAPT
jgi:small multidrug resistance family-3 protein